MDFERDRSLLAAPRQVADLGDHAAGQKIIRGSGCASCHHNGNKITNGEVDDTFQDFNFHEPGVVAETTVDNEGPFTRLGNDYFFQKLGPPQDEGGRQNISCSNPASAASTSASCAPTTSAPWPTTSWAARAPDSAYPEGRLEVDRLGTGNVAPLVVITNGQRQLNPALAANNIRVIKDTHGKTSHLSAQDIEALSAYLRSLQR